MTYALRRTHGAFLLTLALALSSCGDEQKPESRGAAEGEILPGSASDAMVALDTVRSQAPLAPRVAASGRPGDSASTSADAAASPDAGPAESPAPAGEPGPAPTPAAE